MPGLIACSLCLVVSFAAPAMIPQRLSFRLSQAMGSQLELTLQPNGHHGLTLQRTQVFDPPGKPLPLAPSPAQWLELRRELDRLQVWSWPRQCPNSSRVMDGQQWSLEIVYPDRQLRSSGDNCYPDQHGQPVAGGTPSAPFRALIKAFETLIGQSLQL